MSILNLRVWEKGKLANKWKTTFCSVMKEKDKYKKTPIYLFIYLTSLFTLLLFLSLVYKGRSIKSSSKE